MADDAMRADDPRMTDGATEGATVQSAIEARIPLSESHDLTPPDAASTLYGVVLRPPALAWDGERYVGMTLRRADDRAIQAISGVLPAIVERHFVGVVAVSAVLADQAASRLVVEWDAPLTARKHGAASAVDSAGASAGHSAANSAGNSASNVDPVSGTTGITTVTAGRHDTVPTAVPTTFTRDYAWPSPPVHDTCWALAWVHAAGVSIWAPTAQPDALRIEIAMLLGMARDQVQILPTGEAAHAGAFDAAADAALLSRAARRPVRVKSAVEAGSDVPVRMSAGVETGRQAPARSAAVEPLLAGSVPDEWLPNASLSNASLSITTLHIATCGPAVQRPSLARLLAHGGVMPARQAQTVSPYDAASAHSDWHPDGALTSASGVDGPACGLPAPQVFALESFIDELAAKHCVDPVALRLSQLQSDARGHALIRNVADHAGWASNLPPSDGAAQNVLRSGRNAHAGSIHGSPGSDLPDRDHPAREKSGKGRGMAYSCVIDTSTSPPSRTWSAWVADVAVDAASGSVAITRVVVGHDIEHLQPAPAAGRAEPIERQIDGVTRALLAPPGAFDEWGRAAAATNQALRDTLKGDPTALATKTPPTDITWVGPHTDVAVAQPLAWTAAAALPAAAAVANAIFDATGVRLRQPPFNSDAARTQLRGSTTAPERRVAYAWLGGLAATAIGLTVAALPWRAAIAPVAPPDLSIYSAQAIERGRLVAAASDCVVCHTVPGGTPNAGGLKLDTPFGQIVTTNITPDVETGIGNWSYAAFERAMRQGIHRDGRHLYPAFPYTSFAKFTEADMTALYAYMMSQPAVRSDVPATSLAFPYNIRPLMAGWNTLFHDAQAYRPDPTQTLQWNRGAYLVQGAGHCGACHTPRNALGAEQRGPKAFLAGGEAEGWEAPALNRLSRAPIPWNEGDFFQYLSTGFSARHGAAAGPMGPVIHGLQALPPSDVAAMSHYLAHLDGLPAENSATTTAVAMSGAVADANAYQAPTADAARIAQIEAATAPRARVFDAAGERIFEGACAVCHEPQAGPAMAGIKLSLALNSNLHSDQPDNVLLSVLKGVDSPANHATGDMPAFGSTLNDRQIVDVVNYLRDRFAPERPAWTGIEKRLEDLRKH